MLVAKFKDIVIETSIGSCVCNKLSKVKGATLGIIW